MTRKLAVRGAIVIAFAAQAMAWPGLPGWPASVSAETSTVTTLLDAADPDPHDGVCASTLPGGPCTLRAAVQTANANPGADAIEIDDSILETGPPEVSCADATFQLSVAGRGENAAATGDLDITGPLSIGVGCQIFVDGDGIDRVWDVFSDVSFFQVATTGGDATPDAVDTSGSGFRVNGSSAVDLVRSNVFGNGFSAAGFGGGIAAGPDTSVSISNAIVSNNAAQTGGGIATQGRLQVVGFIGFMANNVASAQGGAIFLGPGADAEIRGLTQSTGNTAGAGGFLYVVDANARLSSNDLRGASAENDGGYISIEQDATVGIVNSVLEAGVAGMNGGAIYNEGVLTVVDSGFIADGATNGDGGAIFNATGASLEIQRSFGKGNHANGSAQSGGFLYNEGAAVVANSSIGDSSAQNQGSGIWTSGPLDLRFSAITDGFGNPGPGVGLYVEPGTTDVLVANSVMADNFAGLGDEDCFGAVTLVGILITELGGCTDSMAEPGGGSAIDASVELMFSPSVEGFVAGSESVPHLASADAAIRDLATADECANVVVDGRGAARLGAGDTTCDVGPVEVGAPTLPSSLSVSSATSATDAAFWSFPLAGLPPDAISGALTTAGQGSTESSPLARIDLEGALTGTATPEVTPLARIPLARIPLARIPLARIPLARIGLAQVPLARIPLARIDTPGAVDTWQGLLEGSTLAERPLASVTLADVLDPANWSSTAAFDAFVASFEALTLEQIDLSNTAIGRIPVGALAVADVPLADLAIGLSTIAPPSGEAAREQNLADWCDYFASVGYSCTTTFGIDPQNASSSDDVNLTTVAMVGVPLARIPLARIPLARIPLARIDLLDTPLARIDYRNTPLARIPLARIDLTAAPLARIELAPTPLARIDFAALPLARIPLVDPFTLQPPGDGPLAALLDRRLVDADPIGLGLVVDCSVVACADTAATMGTAFATRSANGVPNGILPTATVADLLAAFPDLTIADATPWILADTETVLGDLGDLAGLRVDELIEALGTEDLDEITLGAVLNGFVAREDVAWDALDLRSRSLAGVDPGSGVVTYSVVLSNDITATEPMVLTIDLPEGWRLVPGGVVDDGRVVDDAAITTTGTTSDVPLELRNFGSVVRVSAFTGLQTGDHQASFSLAVGAQPASAPTSDDAISAVFESFEPNDTPAQASFAFESSVIDADQLYVSTIDAPGDVDLWPILVPRGHELSVSVSGMTKDYDVVLYSPPGATEDPLIGLAGGLRQEPDRSVPFLPDFGLGLGRDDTRVQPGLLQDIPVLPDRRVFAASMGRGATSERIDTPALGGGVYLVQVTGFNGASGTDPYALRASVRPSLSSTTCSSVRPPFLDAPRPQFADSATSGATTLFLLNSDRTTDTWMPTEPVDTQAVFAELDATVSAINAEPSRYGGGTAAVLDLATIGEVSDAYLSWDASRCEPARANRVVRAIGDAIDDATSSNGAPFENVVLIGADDIIPMARVVDGTTLGNEREYARDFDSNNELVASLSYGIVLTDDPYADARPVTIAGRELYVPELAVGRLVEEPSQIALALSMYRQSDGILDANTSAVTGYEFLTDGANAVRDALAGVRSGVVAELISDEWTKAQLDALLGSPDSRLMSINAHFDHNRALPADQSVSGVQSDPVRAVDLGDEGGRRLLFSMGCHAGLSVSDVTIGLLSSADAALRPDWAQELARNGDLLVGNTGYGYGDTDVVAASEKLMTYFAQRLDGSVTIGDALQLAKQRYSSDLSLVTAYDEKVLQQVVMYGLPMYRVSSTPGPLPDRPDGVTPTPTPGGLQTTAFDVALTAGDDGVPSTPSLVPTSVDRGTYWAVDENPDNLLENTGRILTAQYLPIQPQYAVEVTDRTGATEARGAIVTSLASTDIAPVNPANFRPTIDLAANEPEPVVDDTAFPDRIQGLTSFSDAVGDRQQLVLSVGQFLQDAAATDGSGTQRLFTHVAGTVFYVPTSNTDTTPPTIVRAEAVSTAGSPAQFEVDVVDDSAAIAEVVVLSTDVDDPGTWQTTELAPAGGSSWQGTTALPTDGPVLYFVQARDANGNVAVSSKKAEYHLATPVDGDAPTVSAVTDPAGAVTNTDVTVTITASDAGSGVASITFTRDGAAVTVPNSMSLDPFSTSLVVSSAGSTTIGYSAVDHNANESEAATIVVTIDRTPGTIATTVTPTPNSAGWINIPPAAVGASVVEAGDAAGGPLTYGATGALVVAAGTPYPGSPIDVDAAGVTQFTFQSVDAAGNVAIETVDVRIDADAPSASVVTPADGATYAVGQSAAADYACADPPPGSGIAADGCTGDVAAGAPIDTASPGSKSFTVTATDEAGNATTTTVEYTVSVGGAAPIVRADWNRGARDVGFFRDVATMQGSFSDDGDAGPWRITTRWGNGTSTTTTAALAGGFTLVSAPYRRSGAFGVTVEICDAAGNCATDTVTVRLKVPTTSLRPTVQCVTDRGPAFTIPEGRYVASFGWANGRAYWIHAPVGVYNRFVAQGGAADQGQPVLFAPGTATAPVTVVVPQTGVTWKLGSRTAKATTHTRRC